MSYPSYRVRASQLRFELLACSKHALPLLLFAIVVFVPTADLYGQGHGQPMPSRSNVNSRSHHPLDPVPKFKSFQRKIAQKIFGTNPSAQNHRPPIQEHHQLQRMPGNVPYRTPQQNQTYRGETYRGETYRGETYRGETYRGEMHRGERIGVVPDPRKTIGFHDQNRRVNYQQDQLFEEPHGSENAIAAEQRWAEEEVAASHRHNQTAQGLQYESPAEARFSPQAATHMHPQDSRPRAMNPNTSGALPAPAADWNSNYPTNSLRPVRQNPSLQNPGSMNPGSMNPGSMNPGLMNPGFQTSTQYGNPNYAHQQPYSGGHMRSGTPYQGQRFPVSSPTATETALQLQEDVAELEKRVAFLEKVNEQLRQRVNQYENVTSQTTTRMNQAAQQLVKAGESNQKLLKRIAYLETENQKIRLEAARALDSIKHNLDDLLLRELKNSGMADQMNRDR